MGRARIVEAIIRCAIANIIRWKFEDSGLSEVNVMAFVLATPRIRAASESLILKRTL